MLNDRLPVSPRLFLIICLVLVIGGVAVHSSRLILDATAPQPPKKVAAAEGSSSDYVELVWLAVDGAEKYRVYRDGRPIKTVDDVRYRDDGADAGVVHPPVITGVDGRANSVKLNWAKPHTEPGVRHAYSVTAIVDGEESGHSPSVSGYRGAPATTGYQVQIDEGDWLDVDDETSFVVDDVDLPQPVAGTLSATAGDHPGIVVLQLEGTAIDPGAPATYRVRTATDQGVSEPSAPVEGRTETKQKRVRWQRADDEEGEFVDIGETGEGLFFDADDPGDTTSPRYYRAVVETPDGRTDTTEVVKGYPGMVPNCRFGNEEPKALPPMPFAAHNPEEIARLMKTNAEACLEEWEARRYQTVEVLGQRIFDSDDIQQAALIRAGMPGATMGEGRLYTVVQTPAGWFGFRVMNYLSADHGTGGGTDRNTLFVDIEQSDLGRGDSQEVVVHFHQPAYHYFRVPLAEMPDEGEPDVPEPFQRDEVFAAVISFDAGIPQFDGIVRTHCRESTDDTGGVMHEYDVEPFDVGRIELGPGADDTISVQSPTRSGQVELEMPEEYPTYRQSCGE